MWCGGPRYLFLIECALSQYVLHGAVCLLDEVDVRPVRELIEQHHLHLLRIYLQDVHYQEYIHLPGIYRSHHMSVV